MYKRSISDETPEGIGLAEDTGRGCPLRKGKSYRAKVDNKKSS